MPKVAIDIMSEASHYGNTLLALAILAAIMMLVLRRSHSPHWRSTTHYSMREATFSLLYAEQRCSDEVQGLLDTKPQIIFQMCFSASLYVTMTDWGWLTN